MRTGKIEQLAIDVYKRELNKRIGILCLSRKHDSILMWSHYTENHKGFVLGFDSNHDFFKKQGTDEGNIGELRNVAYNDDRPEISFNDIKISTVLYEVKNIDWKYEEEMRLVRNTKNAALTLTDCEPNVFLFDITKDSISSVIFGMQCTEGLQKEIQDLIVGEEELNSVKLFKAYMDRKSYKIQTHEIS